MALISTLLLVLHPSIHPAYLLFTGPTRPPTITPLGPRRGTRRETGSETPILMMLRCRSLCTACRAPGHDGNRLRVRQGMQSGARWSSFDGGGSSGAECAADMLASKLCFDPKHLLRQVRVPAFPAAKRVWNRPPEARRVPTRTAEEHSPL